MNAPYTEGPLDCRICLIGEAPGLTETQLQRPFVGSAGRKLDQLLSRAGVIRSGCRIENVFQFRPAGNDITPFINIEKGRFSPEYYEQKNALLNRLSQCTANVIVPLGNVALYTLTGLSAITKRRGSILTCQELGGRKVIPTIHPSAALQQYIYEHYIVHDLRLILKESEYPDIRLPKRNMILEPSFVDCIAYIERCAMSSEVCFDIEVIADEVSHISLALSPTDGICIPFSEGRKDYFTPDQEAIIWRELALVLENRSIKKIGQNLVFDATFLHNRLGICVHNIGDTMVAQGVIYPDFPKGLDFLTTTYCNGEPYYKDEGKRYMKNPFQSELTFRRYSAMDSLVCAEIMPAQLEDMERLGNTNTYKQQVNIIEPLVFIQEHGILMDVEGMKKASKECEQKIEVLMQELWSICGFEINPNSPKQLKTYFYIKKGCKPYTKNGSITVDEKALRRLAAKGLKEASIILELRHQIKLKSTYFDMRIDSDDRLRCSFNPVGTVSGRISSSKTIFGTGGNMQNQPPEMKKLMLSDPGWVFFSMDLSQAENRVVAYISNETRMINAFEKGIDLHALTAALIFGIPIEQVSDVPGSCNLGGGKFSQRFWGKKANHGLNYDLGSGQFSLLYEIPEHDAKFIIERYHSAYPGVRQWHASVRDQLSKTHRLTDCLGNTRIFMERWGDQMFKEAYSYIPQSTVARKLNRDGLCYAYYNLKHTPLRLCNQVHDSIVFELPLIWSPTELAELVWDIKESLESPIEYHGREFSIPVDTQIGFNLHKDDMKEMKSAKTPDVSSMASQIEQFFSEHSRRVYEQKV